MFRPLILLLAALVFAFHTEAQTDSAILQPAPSDTGGHLRISLITCGPGDQEIWEVFGHTAVRVVDSAYHTDFVYNYGTFEFTPDFEIQFMKGKLLYCLSVYDFRDFLPEYVIAKRSVEEQVLELSPGEKKDIYHFLNWNALPANRFYKYDYFFDNCATRIRDIFPKVLGSHFAFGQTIPAQSKMSIRDIMNRYFYRDHWTRLGVNLLLGSKIDKPMTNEVIMFLPDYLRDGITGATLDGKRIASRADVILPGAETGGAAVNQPFLVMLLVAALIFMGLIIQRLRLVARILTVTVLAVTGLLGCLMVIMWLATDHQNCADNYNLLWCLPTNLIVAFFNPRGKGRYAIIAIILLMVTIFLHLLRVQVVTIFELSPLFLALLLIYGAMYRRSKVQNTTANA